MFDEPPADFDVFPDLALLGRPLPPGLPLLFVPACCLACGAEVLTLDLECRPGRDPGLFDRVGTAWGRPCLALHGCCRARLTLEEADWGDFDGDDPDGWDDDPDAN